MTIKWMDTETGETFTATIDDPREARQLLSAIRIYDNLTLIEN